MYIYINNESSVFKYKQGRELRKEGVFAVSGATSNLPLVLSSGGERSAAYSVLEVTNFCNWSD